jgi:hypothetical protein
MGEVVSIVSPWHLIGVDVVIVRGQSPVKWVRWFAANLSEEEVKRRQYR